MTQNKSYDSLDRLITDHIEEARDLCLRRRPAYAGVEHDFSVEFENRMGQMLGGRHKWLTRLILVAVLTALCSMTIQAGLGSRTDWHFAIDNGQWAQTFALTGPASPGIQAGDLQFSYIPPAYTQIDRDYEQNYYTIRLAAEGEVLSSDPNRMTSLTVNAYWLDSDRLTGSLSNSLVEEAESLRVGDSDALLLTQTDGSCELHFMLDGFEVVIHSSRLDRTELMAFAEGIYFE